MNQNKYFSSTKEFMDAADQETHDKLNRSADYSLRYELLQEELSEYKQACESGNQVEILDALLDLQYVLSGTVHAHGMTPVFDDAFDEVHTSNMSKFSKGYKKYPSGKVKKGDEFKKPKLEPFIKKIS